MPAGFIALARNRYVPGERIKPAVIDRRYSRRGYQGCALDEMVLECALSIRSAIAVPTTEVPCFQLLG